MTTKVKLFDGDMGSEDLRLRCDLSEASAPVEVDYCTGDGWESTQYQCADTRHTTAGLIRLGEILAAKALEIPVDKFSCEAEEVADTYTVSDTGSADAGLAYSEAVRRLAEWYEDMAAWGDGDATPEEHKVVRDAIASVDSPDDTGTLSDLTEYATLICEAVAESQGEKSFAGHGSYYVSAGDRYGLDLGVELDD